MIAGGYFRGKGKRGVQITNVAAGRSDTVRAILGRPSYTQVRPLRTLQTRPSRSRRLGVIHVVGRGVDTTPLAGGDSGSAAGTPQRGARTAGCVDAAAGDRASRSRV